MSESQPGRKSHKLYRTLEDFCRSEYVQRVRDPQVLSKVIVAAGKMVEHLGKGHPLARRIKRSLDVLASLRGDDVFTARNALLLGGALLYVISPLDAVPDPLPLVGLLDDALVLTSVLAGLKLGQGVPESGGLSENAVDDIAAVLPAAAPLFCVWLAGARGVGKSALLNALLGEDVLPVGASLSATVLYAQQRMSVVRLADGSVHRGGVELLRSAEVQEAVLMLPHELLRGGIVLTEVEPGAQHQAEVPSAIICMSAPGVEWHEALELPPGVPLLPVVCQAVSAQEREACAAALRAQLHLEPTAEVYATQALGAEDAGVAQLREALRQLSAPPAAQPARPQSRFRELLARLIPFRKKAP